MYFTGARSVGQQIKPWLVMPMSHMGTSSSTSYSTQIQLPTNKPGKSRRHPEHLVPDTQMGDLDVGPALITAATIWGVNQQWKISSAHSD